MPACWIAGPYRHCRPRRRAVERARAGTAGCRSPTAPCISGARRPVEPALSCARIAGPSQCGGSPAPRGCAGLGDIGPSAASQSSRLGTTVDALSAKLASCPCRAHRGPGHARSRPSRQPACGLLTTHPASGLLTTQPASGPLTIGRRCRRLARSRTPPTWTPGARVPRGPGTRVAGLEVITVRSRHDPFHVRAESARPTSAEQRAQPPFPLNPASGVNRRF